MAAPAAATNGDAKASMLDEVSSKAPEGTVLPPRNIREVIEMVSGYINRGGKAFEDKIKKEQGTTGKMSFLEPDDAYHAYYQWRLSEIRAGRSTHISAGRKADEPSFQGREERKGPEKPPEFQFSARMPNISAMDLEVVKLTALFVAKNGRGWMTSLSQREAGNYQFDFLRPQHSLYQFFSRLVDQYTELLQGDSVDEGRPQKKRIVELESNVKDRARVLERAKKRAEWARYQEAQKVEAEEKTEKERVAYAQIDWHDFVVVETVVFDNGDNESNLPAPTTLNDIQSRSLEQKASWGNDPGRRIEEAMPTFDDQALFSSTTQPQHQPPPQQAYQTYAPAPPAAAAPQPPAIDQSAEMAANRARARAAQQNNQPVKIVQNYTPAASRAKASTANSSICPNCKQLIPNDEMAQHLKIEMLHPEWRDQWKIAQQRSATTNLSTADVAGNLKRLASQRSDVFDPITGRRVDGDAEAERTAKRVEREVGEVAERQAREVVQGVPGGQGLDVQAQIRGIYERAQKGG